MPLTRLIYGSRRIDQGDAALDAILRVSHLRNAEEGVTGALIASDGRFLQVLEGGRASLNRCLGRIMRDARHSDVQIVAAGEVRHRLFPAWAMRRIDTPHALRLLTGRQEAGGPFRPERMSQVMVEDLVRRLAVDLCDPPCA